MIAKIISEVKKGAPMFTLGRLMKGIFDEKSKADELYTQIRVVLDELIMQGYRFESPQIQAVVAILKELPAPGAKRRNFEKLYLQDEYTLRKLPREPKDIPYGHWH